MRKLPVKMKIFLISIYVITLLSLILFVSNGFIKVSLASPVNIAFFAFLMALTETLTVLFKKMSYSTSFAIQLACFLLFGPFTTIIVVIIGFSFRILKVNKQYKHILNTPLYGTISNYCTLILPIIYSNYIYLKLGGNFEINMITSNIIQIIVFCIAVFIFNNTIISILLSLNSNSNFIYCFVSNFKLIFLNILALMPFGIIVAVVFEQYKYIGVLLLIGPIIWVRYTFSLHIESKAKFVQTVDALMRAMEARDKYTEGHSQRVAELASKIAKELGYNEWKIEQLNIASLLHDVGKIGIDDNILNKPGKLTDEEYETIKKHPEIGYNILKDISGLENIISIARYHHERYDGKGYPDGKSVEELSFDVFIVQLADAIDAMATDRPYRKALTEDEILDELKKHSGTQFHPKVVEAYLRIAEKQKKVV